MIANRIFAATRHLSRAPPTSAHAVRFRLAAPTQQLRFFADAIDFHDDDHDWAESFKKATVGVAEMDAKTVDAETSAQRLRDLVKSGLLRHTDLRDNPERFFEGVCIYYYDILTTEIYFIVFFLLTETPPFFTPLVLNDWHLQLIASLLQTLQLLDPAFGYASRSTRICAAVQS